MAKLTRAEILKLARLAKLSLSEDEVDEFRKELSSILDYVEQLSGVDTTGLQSTSQVTGLTNVFRDDVITPYQASPEDLLKNVPSRQGQYIKVKRVIE